MAQLGSAPALGAGGRQFKSDQPDYEQLPRFAGACSFSGSIIRYPAAIAHLQRAPRSSVATPQSVTHGLVTYSITIDAASRP